MKRLFFILSILTMVAYGCNRSDNTSNGPASGMQKEEQRGTNDFGPVNGSGADNNTDSGNMDTDNSSAPDANTQPTGH